MSPTLFRQTKTVISNVAYIVLVIDIIRKLLGMLKETKPSEVVEGLKELNNEQMILQMHCLSLLWNFSETLHDRRLVLQKGGLQLVIKALMLDPNVHSLPSHEYYEVARINETAVGCLVQ